MKVATSQSRQRAPSRNKLIKTKIRRGVGNTMDFRKVVTASPIGMLGVVMTVVAVMLGSHSAVAKRRNADPWGSNANNYGGGSNNYGWGSGPSGGGNSKYGSNNNNYNGNSYSDNNGKPYNNNNNYNNYQQNQPSNNYNSNNYNNNNYGNNNYNNYNNNQVSIPKQQQQAQPSYNNYNRNNYNPSPGPPIPQSAPTAATSGNDDEAPSSKDDSTGYKEIVEQYLTKSCKFSFLPKDLSLLSYMSSTTGEVNVGDVFGIPRPVKREKIRIKPANNAERGSASSQKMMLTV